MAFVYFIYFDLLLLLMSISFHCVLGDENACTLMPGEVREACIRDGEQHTKASCESAGCCWNQQANNATSAACYQKQCRPGFFGWGCKFRCYCMNGDTCNSVTGKCENGCVRDRWGIGCLLESNCTYNDASGQHYMGKKTKTEENRLCLSWISQRAYPASQFPDKDFGSAVNYCRNPKPAESRTWCYWTRSNPRKWGYCSLRQCECPPGRFSINCQQECHCQDPNGVCSPSGVCESGCHSHWSGPSCQDCNDGYFGSFCRNTCHCLDASEVCDKTNGLCQTGCAHGWKGDGCQTECEDAFYGLNCDFRCNCQNSSEVCNKATGSCLSGCRRGFAGEGCRIELPVMTRMPDLETRNATSISIKWREWSNPPDTGTGPVVGYVAYYQAFNETEWIEIVRTTAKSATVSRLPAQNGKYSFRVAAVHQAGLVGLHSPINTFSTCGKPLSGPVKLRLDVKTPQTNDEDDDEDESDMEGQITLTLQWELPSRDLSNCVSLRRFNLYKRPSDSRGPEWSLIQNTAVSRRAVINNVDPYCNLTLGVSLVNNALLESDIEYVTFIGKSNAVSDLEIAAKSSNSLLVRWSVPSVANAFIDYYLLSFREVLVGDSCSSEPGPWSPMMDLDRMEMDINDLAPYSKYEVKVWPQTSAGRGRVAVTSEITDASEPAAVSNLRVVSITSTVVRISWRAPSCEEMHGSFVGYVYEIVAAGESRSRPVSLNRTDVDLVSLTPFTNYTVSVWVSNHAHAGPATRLNFATADDLPLTPRSVVVVNSLSHSLLVAWQPPYPVHGITIGYYIKFHSTSNLSFTPEIIRLDPTVHRCNITDLEPNNTYALQIRAETRVGTGPWSDIIEGYTDESVPSEPQNFVNTSRTSTSVIFSWQPPLRPNGVLQRYRLTCIPLLTSSKLDVPTIEETLSPSVTETSVSNLLPGMRYQCFLRASTSKGFSPPVMKEFWTKPNVIVILSQPTLSPSKKTDITRAVTVKPADSGSFMDEVDSVYRIIVEKVPNSVSTSMHRLKRDSVARQPCGLAHSELVDYLAASNLGVLCYIAAELMIIDSEMLFIVGDNKTYGGYYNAPLKQYENYQIWFGLVVTVDGVTASSYVYSESISEGELPVTQRNVIEPANHSAAMAGAAVGAILAVIIIILVIVIVIYKSGFVQRSHRGTDSERDNLRAFGASDTADTASKIREDRGLISDKSGGDVEDVEEMSEAHAELVPLWSASSSSKPSSSACDLLHQPILVDELWNYVSVKKSAVRCGLRQEYEAIPLGLQHKCETARKPENKTKNRYGNIVAYDHSRVILTDTEDGGTDYINASYIDGYNKPAAFVATQGPSKHTVNDMWRMVWQLRTTRIVMASNLTEDGRHKCEQYWPDSEPKQYGEIIVTPIDVEQFADFKIRTFTVTKNESRRTVRQFHFTAWPDHGVPTYPTSLLAFHKKFRSFDDSSAGPPIVHCSAGVGRTGTFIALDNLLDQAKTEGKVNVWESVRHMRTLRVNMIQTPEQYIFVYDALLESLKCGDTSIPCVDFRSRYCDLQTINSETGRLYILDEYELLAQVTQESGFPEKSKIDGLKPENVNKNRLNSIVPMTKLCRPYLRTYISGSTDYINAVFTDGYKQRDAFIVTQTPLANTVVDFWTLIHDQSCRTIVMMNEQDSTDKTLAEYFPTGSSSLVFGPFTVELVSMDTLNPDIIIRDFLLTFSKRNATLEPLLIRHFEFTGWPVSCSLPRNKLAMLSLLNLLEKWQQRSGNRAILVHCRDGATRSGLVCALSYMVERLKVEQDVDVFQSVKHTRTNRYQIIPTFEQYQFLYDMAVEYMDCFDAYYNFK